MAISDIKDLIIVTKIGTVKVDVSINQNHNFPSRITENPVEDGSTFSDHQVLLPVVLEIEGRVTDAAISLFESLTGKSDSREAYLNLVALQRSKQTFDVVTGLNVYKNMLLEEISFPRSASDGRSLRFTAVLRELLIIGKETKTNRDLVSENVRHTALPTLARGIVSLVT